MNTLLTPETVLALTPLVALVVTALIKWALPKIPGAWLPLLAGLVGILPDLLNAVATGGEASPLKGFLFGLAATGLHQVKVQLNKAEEPKSES